MEIRAAALCAAKTPMEIQSLDLAPPEYGEVLVAIGASGVCHSDYHVISGQAGHDLPVVLGHEGAGVVAAVGGGVTRVAPGDHVVLSWIPFCGECFHCAHEQSHLCRAYSVPLSAGTMLDGTNRLSKGGRPYRQLSMLATWADHAVVPEQACIPISPRVPLEIAALLGCAVTTGVGAVLNKAQVRPDETVAVIGAGGVGLSIIMGAKLAKAGRIFVFDIGSEKEDLARRFGATDFIPSGPGNIQELRAMTHGKGADHVFEAVGKVRLQEMALEMTRPGGRLTFVGLAGNDDLLSLSAANLTRDEKTIAGSIFGSARTDRDLSRYAEYYLDGLLPLDELVTRRYPLEAINTAVADMMSGQPGRGVILFDGQADG